MIVTVEYLAAKDGAIEVKKRRVMVTVENINAVRSQLGLKPVDTLSLLGAVNYIKEFGITTENEVIPSAAMIGFMKTGEESHINFLLEDEGERQMLVMALAHLAVERPGWNDALLSLAMRVNAEKMFDDLRHMHLASRAGFEAIVSNPVDGLAKDFKGNPIPFIGDES